MHTCMCYKLKHFIEIFFSWLYKLSSRPDIYFFLVAYFSFGKYIVYQVGNTVSIRQPVLNWNHCCHTNFKLSQSVKAACPQKVFSFATRYHVFKMCAKILAEFIYNCDAIIIAVIRSNQKKYCSKSHKLHPIFYIPNEPSFAPAYLITDANPRTIF